MTDQTAEIMAEIGDRIRAARQIAGMSLADFAAATNGEFKASVMGAYERGQRAITVPRLVRLARALHVAPHSLLPGWEPEDPLVAARMALRTAQTALNRVEADIR